MVFDYFDKYTFLCEMYDDKADEIVTLVLNFFPLDNSIQIINSSKGKILLKRVQEPSLKMEMLKVGNIINIYSKLLLIRDMAAATQQKAFKKVESTFAIIKPMPPEIYGQVITYLLQHGFRIVQIKNCNLSKAFCISLYPKFKGHSLLPIIIDYMTSGEVIGMELEAPNAVTKLRKCLGATNPKEAAPGTIRSLFGLDTLRNAVHSSSSIENTRNMVNWFFGCENGLQRISYLATLKNCTCCVIKPHVFVDGNVGNIIEHIISSRKFKIAAMATFILRPESSKEFYEIYKGLFSDYEAMSIHLSEGTCLALEILSVDPRANVVTEFRKFCGPRDPDVGRQLYPDTLRARYGKTILYNAVHCTDLPEDGESEVEYFFKLMAIDQAR